MDPTEDEQVVLDAVRDVRFLINSLACVRGALLFRNEQAGDEQGIID